MNERSPREQELLDLAGRLLPGGARSVSPIPGHGMVVKEGRGSRIWDVSGTEYIDYLLGSGPLFLGHAHPAVVTAVREQLERGTSYLVVNEAAVRLAQEIVDAVPCAEQVALYSTGTEATFFAMRLARAYRGRDKILKFEGAFHGMSDYALMSNQWTQTPLDYPAAVPNSAGIPAAVAADMLVAPFNDAETTAAIIEKHRDELAGVIVEPLHRTIPPRDGFLGELRAITSRFEIPLIFDEVVTGFRLAFGGAQERYGVVPDLCALGKSISAGHPLGVVCGREDIMSLASPARGREKLVMQTGTFSGNAVSAVAALASIEVLKQPGVYDDAARRGGRLMCSLQGLFDEAGIAAQVTGETLVFQPWFTSEKIVDFRSTRSADRKISALFTDLLWQHGVVKGHEKFFVSVVHSDEDIDQTLATARTVVEELAAGSRARGEES